MNNVNCPMCGTSNPDELENCHLCGAMLKSVEDTPHIDHEPPDWLKSFRAIGETEQPSADEEDLPDWLKLDQTEIQPLEEMIDKDETDMPDWLSRVDRAGVPEPTPEIPESSVDVSLSKREAVRDDVPDWLAGLRRNIGEIQDNQPIVTAENPPIRDDSEQEWLTGLRTLQQEEEPERFLTTEPAEIEPIQPVPESPPSGLIPALREEPIVPTEGISEWLLELGQKDITEETPEIPEDIETLLPGKREEAIDSGWLARIERPSEEAQEEVKPSISQVAKEEAPDWLTTLETEKALETEKPILVSGDDQAGKYLPEVIAPFTEVEMGTIKEELPEWLARLPAKEIEEVAASSEEETGIERAAIPGWVEAMRPAESGMSFKKVLDEADKRVESAGPLVGLRGVLPAEPEFAQQKKAKGVSQKLRISEKQQKSIALLQGLLQAEGETKPVEEHKVFSSQQILRIVMLLVIALAVLWSKVMGGDQPILPDYAQEVFDTYQVINNIQDQGPVFLAVDYEPGFSPEMDAVAATVLDHLMLKRTYLVMVSTIPTGAAQAERLIRSVNTLHGHQYNKPGQYVNLGYIPGGTSGLLALVETPQRVLPYTSDGSRFWDTVQMQGKTRLSDFSLIVVMTDNPETARAWIEQVQPILKKTPLVMIVSAQAGPLVQPYYLAGQVQGLVTGLAGGGAYEKMMGRMGLVAQRWNGYSGGLLAAVVAILIGGIFNAAYGLRGVIKHAEVEKRT